MLKIRLLRIGRKNQPSFKIVVTDSRRATSSGRFVEEIGFVDRTKKIIQIDKEKAKEWLKKGAQPSPTVFNLLVNEKIIEGKKIPLHKKAKEEGKSQTQGS